MAEILSLPGIKGSFVVGLSWRHEDEVPRASELASRSRLNGRWGAVWHTASDAVQVGFCELPEDVRKPSALRVLAAVIAAHRPSPWIGLFDLGEDQHWLIAVSRGGEIIPDGDACGTLNEMLSLRERHMALGEWGSFEGDVATLAAMVEASSSNVLLRDLQRKPWLTAAYAGGLACTALGLCLAGFVWHHQREVQRLKAEHARQLAILDALQARHDAEANVLPWTREARASEVATVCGEAWARQHLAHGSWTLNQWDCEPGAGLHGGITISTDWVGGLAADAPGQLAGDAKLARLSSHVPRVFAAGSSYAQAESDARRALWVFAQRYDVPLNIQGQREVNDAPGAKSALPAQSAWSRSIATVTFDVPPWGGWSGDLDSLPGVRLKSVSWGAGSTSGPIKGGGAAASDSSHWKATLELYTLNTAVHMDAVAPSGGAAQRHPHGISKKVKS
ncbi:MULTISPECIES: type 4b pilus protein PilO2 [unclassified Paraburkholderia]|uniref:type 4b pilus protein PilO2 n=1 Tax=unclassified Paraburkholderia TaxID=2615204 RepID=UPI002AB2A672|nr:MULTISPECIES: type 4b pilus protein PilO2 [unclassified Paraburkholderia]